MAETVILGRSGLAVSRICLGTMTFGGRTDEAEASRIYARARDAGINFVDTADVYNGGRSEELVGRLIKADRSNVVLATKAANAMSDDPNHRGLSRRWLVDAVEGSLRRLGTDAIDILYLHKEDPHTPLQETVRAVEDLVRSGKIRYFGVSNHRAWRVAEIVRFCDEANITRPVVCQPYYHALYRVIEVELLPACAHFGIGVFCYSPLARGVLSGKYTGAVVPDDSRVGSSDARIIETEFKPQTIAAAQRIVDRARAMGVSPTAYAVAFVNANPIVSGAIAGPRTLAQWEDYLGALDVEWSAEEEEFVESVVPSGSTTVHHYVDPQYPIEGRPTGHLK
ncbi:MAG: aldo/keto reductase [Pseudomonadota bacterium]